MYAVILFRADCIWAQRDTIHIVRFPFQTGFHQEFSGNRFIYDDTSFVVIPISLKQEISEVKKENGADWFVVQTLSQVGNEVLRGHYYISRNTHYVYRWHAGPDWNMLICPTVLYTGLWWNSQHTGQKYTTEVFSTDTIISTPFGSHRCFVIRTETKNILYQGKKHNSLTLDFYDPLIGKVAAKTIIRTRRKGRIVFREEMQLEKFGL